MLIKNNQTAIGLNFIQHILEVCSSLFSVAKNTRVFLMYLKDAINVFYVPSYLLNVLLKVLTADWYGLMLRVLVQKCCHMYLE